MTNNVRLVWNVPLFQPHIAPQSLQSPLTLLYWFQIVVPGAISWLQLFSLFNAEWFIPGDHNLQQLLHCSRTTPRFHCWHSHWYRCIFAVVNLRRVQNASTWRSGLFNGEKRYWNEVWDALLYLQWLWIYRLFSTLLLSYLSVPKTNFKNYGRQILPNFLDLFKCHPLSWAGIWSTHCTLPHLYS